MPLKMQKRLPYFLLSLSASAFGNVFSAQTARVVRRLRMIRDAEVMVAAAQSSFSHRLKRVEPVRAVRMRVENSGDIRIGGKLRESSCNGAGQLTAALAQLGRHRLHPEGLVNADFAGCC